jgi:hypothetical protein
MGWSITVGSVAGTKVRIHITFLLLLARIFFANYFSTGPQAAWDALLCVLLHEFGHIFTARAFGVYTPDVILLPIGGVSRLSAPRPHARKRCCPHGQQKLGFGGALVCRSANTCHRRRGYAGSIELHRDVSCPRNSRRNRSGGRCRSRAPARTFLAEVRRASGSRPGGA